TDGFLILPQFRMAGRIPRSKRTCGGRNFFSVSRISGWLRKFTRPYHPQKFVAIAYHPRIL
ncbi:MAG TPA: hypothetical protein DCQ96_07355, partial [Verrucomicrobiales bacterium]|nr:hypothetical protein [Verrucomicrobiales bacterium]